MKRIHLLVLFALVMPFMGMAAHTYRLGTYNLRIQTSKDTGEKDWEIVRVILQELLLTINTMLSVFRKLQVVDRNRI